MKKDFPSYKFVQKLHSLFMIVALVWMTVSLPFVASAQDQQSSDVAELEVSAVDTSFDIEDEEDADCNGSCNPYGNNTEEKGPNNITQASEEYLHHNDSQHHTVDNYLAHHTLHAVGEYVAFHGELLCPPPNLFS